MKNIRLILLTLAIGVSLVAFKFTGEDHNTLDIGAAAPLTDVKMIDISGKKFSLTDLKAENGLCVIFTCNTCPFVVAWEDRYPEVAALCAENKIGIALVNSNEAKRDGDDSFEAMKSHAKDNNYGELSYLVDEESQLADAFGAKTTPHVFLFNSSLELAYKGAIDDNYKSKSDAKKHYLNDAITNLAAGKEIDPSQTPQKGCSIKRVSM